MSGKTDAFLALTALPAVGAVLLSPRPAWVFRADGTAVLWANRAGAQALAATDIASLLDRRFGPASPLARQVARLAKTLPVAPARLEILKLSSGSNLVSMPAACQRLNLADGERAVLVAAAGTSPGSTAISTGGVPARRDPFVAATAQALAEALAGSGHEAAVIDETGGIVGASSGFSALATDPTKLAEADNGLAAITAADGVRPVGRARFDAGGETLTLVVIAPAAKPEVAEPEQAKPEADMTTATDVTAAIAPWRSQPPPPTADVPVWEDERVVAVAWEQDGPQPEPEPNRDSPEAVPPVPPASAETAGAPGDEQPGSETGAEDNAAPVEPASAAEAAVPDTVSESTPAAPTTPDKPSAGDRPETEATEADKTNPVGTAGGEARKRAPVSGDDDDLDDAARKSIEQGSAGRGDSPEATGRGARRADMQALADWVAAGGPTHEPASDNIVRLPGATATPMPGHEPVAERFRRVSESLARHGRAGREAKERKLPSEGIRRPVSGAPANEPDGGEENAESRPAAAAGDIVALPDTAILDRLPMGLAVLRDDTTLYANPALTRLLGYDDFDDFRDAGGYAAVFAANEPEQASGQSWPPVPGPVGRSGTIGDDDGFDPGSTPGPLTARRKDGAAVAVAARLQAVTWAGAPALMLTVREAAGQPSAGPSPRSDRQEQPRSAAKRQDKAAPTTDRAGSPAAPETSETDSAVEAERRRVRALTEQLAAKEAERNELEAILDTATDGVVVVDGNGAIASLNRSAEALFGIDAGAVTGQPFTALFAEESHRAALDYLDGLAANGVASVLNDGREVIGKVPAGGLIPLFMTMGRLGRTGKFCAVLRDITHWKNVEEELVAARRAAETANSQKSDFLAKISHEIRTPLNAIIGFSEVMMEERFGPVGTARYRDYLRDIHVSGTHMMSLINDLLDLSKIEAGKLELSFEAVAINATIQECVALMQPQANRGRIIIRTSLAAGLPPVVADQRSLRQILLNLLSNAIKFTNQGGQVIVSTAIEDSGEVAIRVRDTGIGMSAEEIETALKPFRQVATSGRERQAGTGLGLPLTKALVEANRAAFTIDSAVDQGTLVKIAFPNTRVLAG